MAATALSPMKSFLFSVAFAIIVLPSFSHAFGAGNIQSISAVEGMNWRHGDIEDTLLSILMARAAGGKKFSKLDVKRVYFGNWLRDYSQAIDVGTVKSVSAEAIRIILWVLGFLSFGYGTQEFEVTAERLGCYRPEEHIDNPKDYADNVDARRYDPRLRPPVDEPRELGIDPRSGLKAYIASEDYNIATSAGLVRWLFGRCIELGRNFARTGNKADLYEALRLLGTGCHCLEDYSAHSNYTELTLLEMGERDIFPHVGRNTGVQIYGLDRPVWPIVTGTFGGVDFFHSVLGEFSDKATQSEVEQLDGALAQSQNHESTSLIKNLLSQLPSGLFGGKDHGATADQLQANAATQQTHQPHVSPRQPEAWALYLAEISKQIYPILEWHDEIMKTISEAIEKIPLLPQLIEQLQDQISIFVFSLIAPFVLPIIRQVKAELATGSEEIIGSSKEKQLIVFHNDNSSDPTHSMLSKDHFSNVLNAPAGRVASEVLKWAVPQLMAAWDDERIDPIRTINRIIAGVFHHPACRGWGEDGAADCRQLMFAAVEHWWVTMDDHTRGTLRNALSRHGVETGQNHRDDVHDTGHGSGKPLALPKIHASGLSSGSTFQGVSQFTNDAVGGGALGGALGGVVGGLVAGEAGSLLGDALGGGGERRKWEQSHTNPDGSFTNTLLETGFASGQDHNQHAQAEYTSTAWQDGARWEQYSRFEQAGHGGAGHGFEQSVGTYPRPDGGFDRYTERRHHRPGGRWESEVHEEQFGADETLEHERRSQHHGKGHGKKHKKHRHYESEGESSSGEEEEAEFESDQDEEGYGRRGGKQEERMRRRERRRRRRGGGSGSGSGDDGSGSDETDSDDHSGSSDRHGRGGGRGRGRGGRGRGRGGRMGRGPGGRRRRSGGSD